MVKRTAFQLQFVNERQQHVETSLKISIFELMPADTVQVDHTLVKQTAWKNSAWFMFY